MESMIEIEISEENKEIFDKFAEEMHYTSSEALKALMDNWEFYNSRVDSRATLTSQNEAMNEAIKEFEICTQKMRAFVVNQLTIKNIIITALRRELAEAKERAQTAEEIALNAQKEIERIRALAEKNMQKSLKTGP
jgi:hypothetical protein